MDKTKNKLAWICIALCLTYFSYKGLESLYDRGYSAGYDQGVIDFADYIKGLPSQGYQY